MQKVSAIAKKVIEYSFYLLFFLVPLVFYSKNFELFEYNKMMLTYAFTIIIACAWLIKMAAAKKIEIRKTPFDKFLLLFLLSQILSTIFSIDVHVSIFGYYSRFHQGLLATISYIILYFAFTTNFPKEKIKNIIYASFASALIVSVWGIFEHFGKSFSCLIITGQFDVNCWVQDVQTRVFATLGQPNWMSAYLAIIIPVSLVLSLRSRAESREKQSQPKNNFPTGLLQSLPSFAMTILFYLAFLFTRSRSGFVALWLGLIIFALVIFLKIKSLKIDCKLKIENCKFLTIPLIFIIITLFFGSGITQIDKYTLGGGLLGGDRQSEARSGSPEVATSPALESGGTESGQIRAIVWKGALDILRHYPIFGSGVETFAFSYYQFRPVEHNMVSEWDFLYNKAHNEYLNFLATTGLFGFLAYMSFIIAFIIWFIKNFVGARRASPAFANQNIFATSLFAGWLTILITNFFGFSTVPVALYFYLIPAIIVIASEVPSLSRGEAKQSHSFYNFPTGLLHPAGPADADKIGIIAGIIAGLFLFYKLVNFYLADLDYAAGLTQAKNQKPKEAYLFLSNAIDKNPLEPIYHDEISTILANLAVSFANQKDEDSAKKFASLALKESDIATKISPNNITFYKTKTKMFYTLSQLDQSFIPRAIDSLSQAGRLAPTDPKIKYNLSLLYSKNNDLEKALKIMEEAVNLKPDYRDSRYALALFYKDKGLTQKAIDQLYYILNNINPKDTEVKEKLNAWL